MLRICLQVSRTTLFFKNVRCAVNTASGVQTILFRCRYSNPGYDKGIIRVMSSYQLPERKTTSDSINQNGTLVTGNDSLLYVSRKYLVLVRSMVALSIGFCMVCVNLFYNKKLPLFSCCRCSCLILHVMKVDSAGLFLNLLEWGTFEMPFLVYEDSLKSLAVFVCMNYYGRLVAGSTISRIYEVPEKTHLKFQLYSLYGFSGTIVEIPHGIARFANQNNVLTNETLAKIRAERGFFARLVESSNVSLHVPTFEEGVDFDSNGVFYDKDRLVQILSNFYNKEE
jgi:hypothetical protein